MSIWIELNIFIILSFYKLDHYDESRYRISCENFENNLSWSITKYNKT
uniref:Uncharacterized protein n=1 Tax=Schistosoma japonicum TaxID=6182 RepID=Q5C3I3_SCHJA|nr:unknown [Schistosoma japonicum]